MNLSNRYRAWAATWSRSQLATLAGLSLVLLAMLLYVAVLHHEMTGIARFWREQYEQKRDGTYYVLDVVNQSTNAKSITLPLGTNRVTIKVKR